MSNWKSYKYDNLKTLPKTSGVYVIYYQNEIAYIGSSENLRQRLIYHERINELVRTTCLVKVKETKKSGECLMVEFRLIKRLIPIYNKKHSSKVIYTRDPYIIAYITKMKVKGISHQGIAKSMNKEGYRDNKGRLWSSISIKQVLTRNGIKS